jgi:hypothetical protein
VLAVVVVAGVVTFLVQLKGGIDGVRVKQPDQPEEILNAPQIEAEPPQAEVLPPPRVESPDQPSSGR